MFIFVLTDEICKDGEEVALSCLPYLVCTLTCISGLSGEEFTPLNEKMCKWNYRVNGVV